MAVNPEVQRLARKVLELERWRLQSKQANLGFSSVEDGALTVRDVDGVARQIIGTQPDGTYTTIDLNADPGPVPDAPDVLGRAGFLIVSSYGLTASAADWPLDFLSIEIHVSATPGFTFSAGTKVGEFKVDGGQQAFGLTAGTYYVVLVSRNTSGALSAASPEVSAEVGTPGSDTDPTEEPSESPEIILLTGGPGFLAVRTETVDAAQEIEYHIWDSSIGDETYVATPGDPTTMFIRNRSSLQMIDRLPSGAPLAEDTTYYVQVWAKNSIGYAATPSAVGQVQMDMSAIRELIVLELTTGAVYSGSITIGSGYWNSEEGLVFLDEDGNPFIQIPADPAEVAQIKAFIRATGITIEDNANLYGLAQEFGTFRLTNGVPDPKIRATMARTWNKIETDLGNGTTFDPAWGPIWRGMAPKIGDATKFITAVSFFGGTVREIDLATGVHNAFVFPDLGDYWIDGGICTIGSFYYMLGKDYTSSRGGDWWVRKYNSSYVLQAEWFFIAASGLTKRPAIGTDGTNILVARCTTSGNLRLTEQTTAGGAVQDVQLIGGGQSYDLGGAFRGAADFPSAAVRLVVQPVKSSALAFNTSHARQTAHEWERANGAQVLGMMWDGTRFKTVDATGAVWDLADGHPITSTEYGTYTWVDEDTSGGSIRHETAAAIAQSFVWPARSRLVITGQPAPDVGNLDVGNLDKANLLRIYNGPSAVTMRLQSGGGTNGALPIGTVALGLENPDVASAIAPTSTTFNTVVGATAGKIESARIAADSSPVTIIGGDGTTRFMQMRQQGLFSTGTVVANTITTFSVTFAEEFDVAPDVICWVEGGRPTLFEAWATPVTTTGFTLNYLRSSGTGTRNVIWEATIRTQ